MVSLSLLPVANSNLAVLLSDAYGRPPLTVYVRILKLGTGCQGYGFRVPGSGLGTQKTSTAFGDLQQFLSSCPAPQVFLCFFEVPVSALDAVSEYVCASNPMLISDTSKAWIVPGVACSEVSITCVFKVVIGVFASAKCMQIVTRTVVTTEVFLYTGS